MSEVLVEAGARGAAEQTGLKPVCRDGKHRNAPKLLRERFGKLSADGSKSIEDELRIEAGSMADYAALSGFHYRGVRPGAVTSVVRIVRRGEHVVRRYVAQGGRDARGCYQFKQNSNNAEVVGGDEADVVGGSDVGVVGDGSVEVVGVLVRSLPHLSCRLRDVATGGRYKGLGKREAAVMLNREVRCISRVVIDPRWRGLGLAVKLVRWALENPERSEAEMVADGDPRLPRLGGVGCGGGTGVGSSDAASKIAEVKVGSSDAAFGATILYTEALAVMGRVSPFFERAGMVKFERGVRCRVEHARLIDAMERVGIEREMLWRPAMVMEQLRERGQAEVLWFEGELRRWYGAAHRMRKVDVRAMGMDVLLRAASEEVMEAPVYYVFGHGEG